MLWVGLLVGAYVLLAFLVYRAQDRLLFLGAGIGRGVPIEAAEGLTVDWLTLPDGTRIRFAWAEPAAPRAAVVFADGNGGDLRSGARWALWFRERGCATLSYEYPGYGDSDGTPSVASFEMAARAAADAARRRRPDLPLAAAGLSLGTFSAVQLAAEQRVSRLLLLAPPTSLLTSASEHYRWLPVRWLLRHRFDSLVRAPQITCPTLIVHGLDDRVVPAAHGRALAAAIGPHARFLGLPGHGHDDLPLEPHGRLATEIASFLGGG